MALLSFNLPSSFFLASFAVFCIAINLFSITNAPSGAEAARGDCLPVSSLITKQLFHTLFLHKDDTACPAKDFYTYRSFSKASKSFPGFGTTGSLTTRKREIAAFLAQISHKTTGGRPTAPDGPYAWGLFFKEEISPQSDYCDSTNKEWPCSPGKSYKGRGPIQLSWNYNYGPAGKALGFDGLKNPEVVANNSMIALKTALWLWMTEQKPKPSSHDVMVGLHVPTEADVAANRTVGYGLVTNIISGGLEYGISNDERVNDRIGYFNRYGGVLHVDAGPNLDCENQKSS